MALAGTLKDVSLADIFQLIALQKKTGYLTLRNEADVVTVTFMEGSVVGAESLNKRLEDRLGHVLVKTGRISREELAKALDEPPSLLGMSERQRRLLLAHLEAAVLGRLTRDGAVTRGLSAHLIVMGVSHVFKVRIIADLEDRTRLMMEREKLGREQSLKAIIQADQERARWVEATYRLDEGDPALYDLVINLGQIDAQRAVEIIADTVQAKKFQPMTFSLKLIEDKALAARVRASLAAEHEEVSVQADGGKVVIKAQALKREQQKKALSIMDKAKALEGVSQVEVHVIQDIFADAAQGMRQGLR